MSSCYARQPASKAGGAFLTTPYAVVYLGCMPEILSSDISQPHTLSPNNR